MRTLLVVSMLAVACEDQDVTDLPPLNTGNGGQEDDEDDGGGGGNAGGGGAGCGEVTFPDVTVRGRVLDDAGKPAVGAKVELQERNYTIGGPAIWGEDTIVDAKGDFEFPAAMVPSPEDCWGTLVDYVLVADGGTSRGCKEQDVNQPVRSGALYNGVVNLASIPIQLDPKAICP